jgi:diacylglycerol kinase family enzyme
MRRVLIIINAKGGNTEADDAENYIKTRLEGTDIDYNLHVIADIDEIKELTDKAVETKTNEIFVMGGDGTISIIANRIIGTDIILTILPGGTGNQMAKYFEIPNYLPKAMNIALNSNKVVRMDTLRLGNRRALLNLSMGLSSLTMVRVGAQLKKAIGNAGYIGALLEILIRYPSFRFHVKMDGTERVICGRELLIMNTSFKNMPLSPVFTRSNPFDGTVECYVFQIRGILSFLSLIADTVTRQTSRNHRYLEKFSFSDFIEISKIEGIPFQVDGDEVPFEGIRAEVDKESLSVRVAE